MRHIGWLLRRLTAQKRNSPLDTWRLCLGLIVAASVIGRPVRLGSVRWWRAPAIASFVGLTQDQTREIDRLYQERLPARRRCIERFVQASNRVDQLLRDGLYEEDTLRQTQAVVNAAAEERTVARALHGQLAGILSAVQRERVEQLLRAGVIE